MALSFKESSGVMNDAIVWYLNEFLDLLSHPCTRTLRFDSRHSGHRKLIEYKELKIEFQNIELKNLLILIGFGFKV
ncbi:CLUMA_CG001193, isoform A [Clunio marinus]|uniref:CLUMA_CG001193, isoform A n=1 Tax=Clunio marinus TaxID=568069 RepID=A0A1J1HH92_9DIPT|nr:CLUMA_CG001193, isoform A [Clunio marinus]